MDTVQALQEQLAIKEQENQQLMAQLAHLRSWMNSLQQRARANDPHALLVARELYVGGVPEGTTEVRGRASGFFGTHVGDLAGQRWNIGGEGLRGTCQQEGQDCWSRGCSSSSRRRRREADMG